MVETIKAVGRAIYARLSQDRGKLSENVDIQIAEGQDYFADQGWPVDERLIFSDNDISASIFSDKERPGWLDLLAAIRVGLAEVSWLSVDGLVRAVGVGGGQGPGLR